MTHMQMALDILSYRMGHMTKDELRRAFRGWQVPPDRAKWEVGMADKAGPVKPK